MIDNVINMPTPLDRLTVSIKRSLQLRREGDQQWRDATVTLCLSLAEARDQFPSDQAFGAWFDGSGFDLNVMDRAAAIRMGKQPDTLRVVLIDIASHSLQLISRDSRFISANKPTIPGIITPPKPKRESIKTNDARKIVKEALESGKAIDESLRRQHGFSAGTFGKAKAAEEARLEAKQEALDLSPIDTSILNETYRIKFERLEAKLNAQLETRIQDEVTRRIKQHFAEDVLPQYEKKLATADLVLRHDKPFTNAEYLSILGALHSDTTSAERRDTAFALIKSREIVLRSEERPKRLASDLPKTLGELMARRKPLKTR